MDPFNSFLAFCAVAVIALVAYALIKSKKDNLSILAELKNMLHIHAQNVAASVQAVTTASQAIAATPQAAKTGSSLFSLPNGFAPVQSNAGAGSTFVGSPGGGPNETLAQYASRTAATTGFNTSEIGALLQAASTYPAGINMEAVDRYLHQGEHQTQAQQSTDTAAAARDQASADAPYNGVYPVGLLTDEDKLYLYKMITPYKQLTGRDIYQDALYGAGIDVRRAINWAGSDNAARMNAYDPTTYSGPLKQLIDTRMAGG